MVFGTTSTSAGIQTMATARHTSGAAWVQPSTLHCHQVESTSIGCPWPRSPLRASSTSGSRELTSVSTATGCTTATRRQRWSICNCPTGVPTGSSLLPGPAVPSGAVLMGRGPTAGRVATSAATSSRISPATSRSWLKARRPGRRRAPNRSSWRSSGRARPTTSRTRS